MALHLTRGIHNLRFIYRFVLCTSVTLLQMWLRPENIANDFLQHSNKRPSPYCFFSHSGVHSTAPAFSISFGPSSLQNQIPYTVHISVRQKSFLSTVMLLISMHSTSTNSGQLVVCIYYLNHPNMHIYFFILIRLYNNMYIMPCILIIHEGQSLF